MIINLYLAIKIVHVILYRPTSFGVVHNSWRIFTYKELHAATNGFSDDNKLGEGGFGSVYWGRTNDGLQVKIEIIAFIIGFANNSAKFIIYG